MPNREIQMIGNAALLELPGKVAFFSSRNRWILEHCDEVVLG